MKETIIMNEIPLSHSPLTIIKPSFPIVSIKLSTDLSTKAFECEYHLGFDIK